MRYNLSIKEVRAKIEGEKKGLQHYWPKNAVTVGPTGGSRSCLICKKSLAGTSLGEGCYLFA